MLLSTPAQSSALSGYLMAPTVTEPGEKFSLGLQLATQADCLITDVALQLPDVISPASNPDNEKQFPLKLPAGNPHVLTYEMKSNDEGFGLIKAEVSFEIKAGVTQKLQWEVWVSVLKHANATEQQLDIYLRKRLIEVVNARPQNGHIFLSDYAAFFEDFLNISIPDRIARIISQDFGLPDEGLPVDPETRLQVILGKMRFYAIEKLELIAEEECPESDDRFDPEPLREVENN